MNALYPEIQTGHDVDMAFLHPTTPAKWGAAVGDWPWGPCHEIGHIFQSDAWTWGDTTEVTVNLVRENAFVPTTGLGWAVEGSAPAGRRLRALLASLGRAGRWVPAGN